MSISATLSNAMSGLTAASRGAQVVSTNVANATTEGYARREIELSSRLTGGIGAGVQVDGVSRAIDNTLLRERRLADAAVGNASVPAKFYSDIQKLLGLPDDPSSLEASFVDLESAFLEASFRPDSETRLYGVLAAAETLTQKLKTASEGVQQLRVDTDRQIESEVNRLNTSLEQIAELNGEILRAKGTGRDYPSLLDQRQSLIDSISEIVPLRLLPRDNDTVALYTLGGALLVDTQPSIFEFQATEPITADMTQGTGALSGLTINDNPQNTSGNYSPIAGGSLSALFELRDENAVDVQNNLDVIAQDLISRFQDQTLDPTLTITDPGLFTDRGAVLNPANTIGLASRVTINGQIDPSQGGAIWRLRSGIGSATAGSVGDATLLQSSAAVLGALLPPGGGSFGTAARSASGLASSLTSLIGQASASESNRLTFQQARFTGLNDAELINGVDTDQELQKLLLIEQSYAANARVIQVADELLQLLTRL